MDQQREKAIAERLGAMAMELRAANDSKIKHRCRAYVMNDKIKEELLCRVSSDMEY